MAAFGSFYGSDTTTWNANYVYGASNTLANNYYWSPVPKETPRSTWTPLSGRALERARLAELRSHPPEVVPLAVAAPAQRVEFHRKTPRSRGPIGWVRRPAGRPL